MPRSVAELLEHAVQHFGDRVAILLPSIVRILWELPHTANGKVDVPAFATRLNPCIDGT